MLVMPDSDRLFIAAVFLLAGFIKGVVGLGLPTVAMGLLAMAMPPAQAAAILVLPSFLTNVSQMLTGPALAALARRLWPMLLCICLGTWAGAELMTDAYARQAGFALGAALVLYASSGLLAFHPSISRHHELWLGPIIGAITGGVTAASGVFVMPAVPYLQAIGLGKDELIQALGLSFMVSTVALAVNLFRLGAIDAPLAGGATLATIAAFVGMCVGQALRARLQSASFRRWFFGGLLALGVHLVARALA